MCTCCQTLAALQPVGAGTQPGIEALETSAGDAAAGAAPTTAAAAIPEPQGAEGVGELVLPTHAAAQPLSRIIVLVYGPPMAGTSSQAAKLGSRYNVPCVDIDTLLKVSLL